MLISSDNRLLVDGESRTWGSCDVEGALTGCLRWGRSRDALGEVGDEEAEATFAVVVGRATEDSDRKWPLMEGRLAGGGCDQPLTWMKLKG